MTRIVIPKDYDYVGAYLTSRCFLKCPYCITNHFDSGFQNQKNEHLSPGQWIQGLNKIQLPRGVPLTLQGGEPFLYPGIWEILSHVKHKMDILTALPPKVKREDFLKLKTLDWNRRKAPYPTIRVSFHKGQHDPKELINRIKELNDLVSIGLYYIEHPSNTPEELRELIAFADQQGVELRSKEFLGQWGGKQYGAYLYKDACSGVSQGIMVKCKNTVVPIGPDGSVFRCHSDLYFDRRYAALGNILDPRLEFPKTHSVCRNYGLCNECDVKIKTDHTQTFGYTSVNIKFPAKQRATQDA